MTNLGCKLQSLSEQQSAKTANQPKKLSFLLKATHANHKHNEPMGPWLYLT